MAKGNAIRDQFYKAVYDQIQDNALQNGVAQGSNFWNLYTVGTGANDPYQVTLADTSTMDVISAHVRALQRPQPPHVQLRRADVLTDVLTRGWMLLLDLSMTQPF